MTRTLLVLAAILLVGTAASTQSISIARDGDAFKVVGWTPPSAPPPGGWAGVFSLSVAGAADTAPMLGAYTVEKGTLVFRPQYPLAPGVHYRAVFHPPGGRAPLTLAVDGPLKSTVPLTRVEHVFPSSDILPSNQLRLYLYFSAPMSRGEAGRRIHLLDKNARELNAEFLPGEELWDPGMQRLTLTFDPGRIKRGLASNERMGPPIAEGQRYTLVVDREWPDARGVPLVEAFRKTFVGGPAVRVPPDPKQWKITPPRPGTSDPLVVDFDRPMNYTLLQRMLRVAGPRGPVAGTIDVRRDESEWRLTPAAPWMNGAYHLDVDTGLEDLAGNRIGQPFDIDVFDHVTEHITTSTITIPIVVR